MTYLRQVSKTVANNPIARAVARQQLRRALVDQQIALYLMEPGEDCAELIEGLGTTLSMIGVAAEFEPKLKLDDPRLKVLRGGLSACKQLLLSSAGYDPAQTVAICRALDEAESLNRDISAESIQKAYMALRNVQ